jgi:hypothetical protein
MVSRLSMLIGVIALAGVLSLGATGGRALTMQECSVKYKAAQSAGTLAGKTWNQFRKDECGPKAAAAQSAGQTPAPNTAAPTATPSNAVFPTAVSPTYSKESAGKARMHTCLDQYRANKATGGNGGLTWIQKGGGYYSECNKRLKS